MKHFAIIKINCICVFSHLSLPAMEGSYFLSFWIAVGVSLSGVLSQFQGDFFLKFGMNGQGWLLK